MFSCLPDRTRREQAQVTIGTHLFLACLWLVTKVTQQGGWAVLENPSDPGCEPYPSFFHSKQVRETTTLVGATVLVTDQCQFGVNYFKRTGLWCADERIRPTMVKQCMCVTHEARPLINPETGKFASAAMARYPVQFSQALADTCITVILNPKPRSATGDPTWRPLLFPGDLTVALRLLVSAAPQL